MMQRSQTTLLFERYLLKFTPVYQSVSAVHSVKTIEQYRKMAWEYTPSIACDAFSFIIIMATLSFLFLGLVSIFTVLCRGVSHFYLYRSRLYEHLMSQERAATDVLKLRLSNIEMRQSIPLINRYLLFKKYLNVFRSFQHYEDKISQFNFCWDELTRIVSFLGLFILFTLSFIGV